MSFEPMFDLAYVQGYTAALQDARAQIEGIQYDLKRHKRKQNAKTYLELLDCMIDNRTALREIPHAFIRCKSDGAFELWWDGRHNE